MKRINKKRIVKDVLIALVYGFISVMTIVGAVTLTIAQASFTFIFIGTIISALVCYGIYAVFKGFSMGYFLPSDDAKTSGE